MARKPVIDMSAWPSVSLEGNLIAPAMVATIDRREAPEQDEADYGVRKGLTLRDEISTAFRVGQSHFDAFSKLENPSAEATRRFVQDFLRETFGFGDLGPGNDIVALMAGKGRVPVVVVPPNEEKLDRKSPTLSTDRTRSAAFALQDWLNEHDEALWGLVTNGRTLRLMRDNASLTRPAYIEADLAQIFTNEDAASFSILWLLIHRSRFGAAGAPVTDCALERWREAGAREGVAARDHLADQVQMALKLLGSGFLGANPDLRTRLQSGEVNLTDWFNELLRLVYRLIFLMVAEDRNLLHPENARTPARDLYARGYSLTMLRAACTRGATWDRHHDRYEGIKVVFRALATGEPRLGLPALGGLFAHDKLPTLETARLSNRAFMEAIYRLSWLRQKTGMVPVNWRAMETEELGSVYESLLELQPQLSEDGRELIFASEAAEKKGNQRKTTGSYYTPDSLVQALLDTALDPVLDKTEAQADDPEQALLNLSIIDPACGSGHFLLAAARRIATRLARIRAEGTPAMSDFRHALRDVARACLYGVDRNPMAVELTKVALWIETVDPGKPLGFFDAQIRCGDALLGVFDLKVLEDGIPDAAYKPLTGDDKDTARFYLKTNRDEKSGQGSFDFSGGRSSLPAAPLSAEFAELRDLPEDSVAEVEAKARAYRNLRKQQAFQRARMGCNLYVSAFLLPKAGPVPRGDGERRVPTSEDVWQAIGQGKGRRPIMENAHAATSARALHWPLEFPDVMQRGGFDVVLGNPPYGAKVEARARECIKCTHPETAGASNTCADFISLAVELMSEKGMFGLVVPKSVTFSNSWRGVRAIALPRLVSTVDIGQAWANVALEMVLLFCSKRKQEGSQLPLYRKLDAPVMSISRSLADGLGIIPTGLSKQDQQALEQIREFLRPNRTPEFSTSRGKALQKLAREEGDIELLAGRNIAPMQLREPWRYIDSSQIDEKFILPQGSVVFQNIVAHLLNPCDHIRLIGTTTDRRTVPLDTVNIIHHPQRYSSRSVAAFLMSDFICWFVYVAGFNRAVRTMHFDNYILQKLPSTPQEIFTRLDQAMPDHGAELTSNDWENINEIVNQSYGLDEKTSLYISQMHSKKGN